MKYRLSSDLLSFDTPVRWKHTWELKNERELSLIRVESHLIKSESLSIRIIINYTQVGGAVMEGGGCVDILFDAFLMKWRH